MSVNGIGDNSVSVGEARYSVWGRAKYLALVVLAVVSASCSSGAGRLQVTGGSHYFPLPPAVSSGRTVSYHGLDFTVPTTWVVLSGHLYGGCLIDGPAIVIGTPDSSETCNLPSRAGAGGPVIYMQREAGTSQGAMPVAESETITTADGISILLVRGYGVSSGVASLGRVAKKPPSSIVPWELAAKITAYNISLSATNDAPQDASPSAAFGSIMAVLLSVRPVGSAVRGPSPKRDAASRLSARKAGSELVTVLTFAKASFGLAGSSFSRVSPATLHASDPQLKFVDGTGSFGRSSGAGVVSIDTFTSTGVAGVRSPPAQAFAATVWDNAANRCYGVLDIEAPMSAWYSGAVSAAMRAVAGVRSIQSTAGEYFFTGRDPKSCYADAVVTTPMQRQA